MPNEIELIDLAKQGDDFAFEQLFTTYKNLVASICRRYFLIGGETDDLLQEGMIGLYKAVKTYDPSKSTTFSTYATTLVQRQVMNAIKQANSQKHAVMQDYVALNNQGGIEGKAGDGESYFVAKTTQATPESFIVNQEELKQLLKQIASVLSPYEQTILEEYLNGYTYKQIAQHLNKSSKSIDNALNRIKTKLQFLNKQ